MASNYKSYYCKVEFKNGFSRGSRQWSRKTLNSPPLRYISKLQLHIEQHSLRMTQKLVEWLFYKQGCKERTTLSLVGREK